MFGACANLLARRSDISISNPVGITDQSKGELT
jgi:hypothetical protein